MRHGATGRRAVLVRSAAVAFPHTFWASGCLALALLVVGCTLAPEATWSATHGEAANASLGGRTLPDDDTSAPTNAYVVDRITDGTWAVLEGPSGTTRDVPLDWLPTGVEEGDVVRVTVEGTTAAGAAQAPTRHVSFALDREETVRRRADASEMRDRLRKGPSGDLDL